MADVSASQQKVKTVADPTASYESIYDLWIKSRAVCKGERFVKDIDRVLDTASYRNLLIPFSPSMDQLQYNFYRAEAEFPGIVAQYAKMLVGGLLRKPPQLTLPESIPQEAKSWILNEFGQDSSPLVHFLDGALWEEMQTSRAWVMVDYPHISSADKDKMLPEDFKKIKPYPVLIPAESIVNWRLGRSDENGGQELKMLVIRNYELKYGEEGSEFEFHPKFIDTVWVHELVDGLYRVRKFQESANTSPVRVVNGHVQQEYNGTSTVKFNLIDTIDIEINGEPARSIPAWPLNGNYEPVEPLLTPLIDKEIVLYNKLSRRNHLMYGAATYTPYIMSDMENSEFEAIVNKGLGSWFKIGANDKADVLKTPTEALQDMEKAIAAHIEEMAKMGIRMLTPESSQSGVALDIRNAAQTAQLGTLNTKISNQFRSIICFMINWRYDLQLTIDDVNFELSADFNPAPLGADWLRLATEWYQQGLIPRSIWLQILKLNDIMPPEYDDKVGQQEINADEMIATPKEQMDFAQQMQQQQLDLQQQSSQQVKK